MQDIGITPISVQAALVGPSRTQPQPRAEGQVPARDLHPGDVVQQYDWPLHVCAVTLSPTAVTIEVTEFEFPLHYAADAQVRLTA